jgi:hypothetical protein
MRPDINGSGRASAHCAGQDQQRRRAPERCSDQEGAETDAEQPSQHAMQWQVERQHIGICNRPD